MFTGGLDPGLAALNHHPNFEVRVFNPFASRSARFLDGVTDFSRINRRMHNKSFTVDNQLTILGGRNIADEYFGHRVDARFGDLDVLSVGPLVSEVSSSFDAYWNHTRAAPLSAFAKQTDNPAAALSQLRVNLENARRNVAGDVYAEAVRASAESFIESARTLYSWAPYALVVDSPEKNYKEQAGEASAMKFRLSETLSTAESEMILISPYFVPLRSGIKALNEIERRGVEVLVVTNSLAANNQFMVHGSWFMVHGLKCGGMRSLQARNWLQRIVQSQPCTQKPS